jgi:hypothetical protein
MSLSREGKKLNEVLSELQLKGDVYMKQVPPAPVSQFAVHSPLLH